MIAVIEREDGGFNLIGTANDVFILQGNLTREQLAELHAKSGEALGKEESNDND